MKWLWNNYDNFNKQFWIWAEIRILIWSGQSANSPGGIVRFHLLATNIRLFPIKYLFVNSERLL